MRLIVLVHWYLKYGLWVLDYCRTKQLVSQLPRLAPNMMCFKAIVENLLGSCTLKCYKYNHVPRDGVSASSGSLQEIFPLDAVNPDSEIKAKLQSFYSPDGEWTSRIYCLQIFSLHSSRVRKAENKRNGGEGQENKRWHRAKKKKKKRKWGVEGNKCSIPCGLVCDSLHDQESGRSRLSVRLWIRS